MILWQFLGYQPGAIFNWHGGGVIGTVENYGEKYTNDADEDLRLWHSFGYSRLFFLGL